MHNKQTMSPVDARHPDRMKWNERFRSEVHLRSLDPSLLLASVQAAGLPDGPVVELACGVSGNALALAESGRDVLAVDVSDVALERLAAEAEARGLSERITCIQADLPLWRPPDGKRFALVLCVMYWDAEVFDYACAAVKSGGIVAWQAFSMDQVRYRPSIRPGICLQKGEPASRFLSDFTVIEEEDDDDGHRAVRRMVARKT